MTYFDEILSLPELANAKVIGGKNGLSNPIMWFHILYDVVIEPWIGEYNLIYTNGSGLNYPEQDLLSMLKQLKMAKASGIIIEIGRYIQIISPKVVSLANELELPLIELPGKTNLTGLTKSVSYICFENEKNLQRKELLKKMIYFPEEINSETRRELLLDFVFPYIPLVLFIRNDNPTNRRRMVKSILKYMCVTFEIVEEQFLYFERNNYYICLIPFANDRGDLIENLQNVISYSENQLNTVIQFGCGTVINDYSEMAVGVFRAECSNEYINLFDNDNKIRFFKDMGIFSIFFEYQNDRKLMDLYENIVGKLISYDAENNVQFLDTLRIYFDSNCNLTEAAEKMFIHKNTLKYRLSRIKDILEVNFDEPNFAFTIQLAFKIESFIKAKNSLKDGR